MAVSHGAHKDPRVPSHVKGLAAVLDCLLLARCDYLIKNRSSLSDVSLAFNPRLPWSFIIDEARVSQHAPIEVAS